MEIKLVKDSRNAVVSVTMGELYRDGKLLVLATENTNAETFAGVVIFDATGNLYSGSVQDFTMADFEEFRGIIEISA